MGKIRFSLCALLAFVTGICILLAAWIAPAVRERSRVSAIRRAGGFVHFESTKLPEGYMTHPTLVRLREGASAESLQHVNRLTSVKCLDLSESDVTDALLSHLNAPHLEVLYLDRTSVGDAGMSHVCRLSGLSQLILNHTQVGDNGLKSLVGLKSLYGLTLEGTDVGDAGLEHLSRITSLTCLDLRNTQVSDRGMQYIAALPDLRLLYLDGTQVGDDGLENLRTMKTLQCIKLDGTRVTDSGLEFLTELPNLDSISLHKTQVSRDACVRLSRQMKPGAWVVSSSGHSIQTPLP